MEEEPSKMHVANIASCDLHAVQELVRDRLVFEMKLASAAIAKKKIPSKSAKSAGVVGSTSVLNSSSALPRTPGRPGTTSKRIFQRPLRDLSMVLIPFQQDQSSEETTDSKDCDSDLLVPKVLVTLCEWLRGLDDADDSHSSRMCTEGIFRKAGSANRQKLLRERLESSENWDQILDEANGSGFGATLDASSVLKQWIRELPEPLLPEAVQKIMIESCQLETPSLRDEAILLASCLLSTNHASTLTFLLRFLADVAENASHNKMDVTNLAIVLAPTMFSAEDGISRKKSDAGDDMAHKVKVIEVLIRNAKVACVLQGSICETYVQSLASSAAISSQSDDNLDDDHSSVGGHAGPSARRCKKKKRRSGSLSRVLTAPFRGIQKAMSRTATPVAPSKYQGQNQSQFAATHTDSFHCTPLPGPDQQAQRRIFTSPRLPVKRRAQAGGLSSQMQPESSDYEEHVLPMSKLQRKAEMAAYTPKLRGRSFSVKGKFKRKKMTKAEQTLSKGENDEGLLSFSPLPVKPIPGLAATPSTPNGFDLPVASLDIASPLPEFAQSALTDFERDANQASSESFTAASEIAGGQPLSTPSSSAVFLDSPGRSFRSRDQALPPVFISEEGTMSTKGAKEPLFGEPSMSTSLSALSVSKKATESLSNLKSDLSSFIEKSFASGQCLEHSGVDGDPLMRHTTVDGVTSSTFRRQSSAFELARSSILDRQQQQNIKMKRGSQHSKDMRRQSSAFEIGASLSRERAQQVYDSFDRIATRASLRRKNSSVKDLIKKLEGERPKLPALPKPSNRRSFLEPPPPEPLEEEAAFPSTAAEESWVDASEFFSNKALSRLKIEETSPGCKRSSIVKIRRENRGLVSKSVETFTKPMMLPPLPPAPPAAPPALRASLTPKAPASRRMSARMGVSAAGGATSAGPGAMRALTPVASMHRTPGSNVGSTARRQTLTGIRTSANLKVSDKSRSTPTPATPQAHSHVSKSPSAACSPYVAGAVTGSSTSKKLVASNRRSARLETRRHLTIGYDGEVSRSPLRERQNQAVTVQRSKSAQIPHTKSRPVGTHSKLTLEVMEPRVKRQTPSEGRRPDNCFSPRTYATFGR